MYFQISNSPVNTLPVSYPVHTLEHSTLSPDDLPNKVVMTLTHGSPIMSMDFHPIQQILLVGMFYEVFIFCNVI